MKKTIEYPTDKPLVDHPLYAFTVREKPDNLIDALCRFYECGKSQLIGRFEGDLYKCHKYAFDVAWAHLKGSQYATPTALRAEEVAKSGTPDTTPAIRAPR